MSSTYGKNIRVTIFGESHAAAIGVTIEGLPAGIAIDTEELQAFLDRRAPGKDRFSTARKESDTPEFLCGVKDVKTCGTPVTAIIRNSDQHSSDYASIADTPRPGHADYTAEVKYGGFQDKAGGGHFSGRLTAPLCIAGGIALQILKKQGIGVAGRVTAIGGITEREEAMLQAIEQAKAEGDSVGGIVECVATGVPTGLGDPMFDGMENRIASAVFGIPAVKGVEFGEGFGAAALKGSENNDA
ncbi:MAG: chorismate synthase, partial [Firmicutes bacterium]|nr:chorismate synthase [Bacillota bacterium]